MRPITSGCEASPATNISATWQPISARLKAVVVLAAMPVCDGQPGKATTGAEARGTSSSTPITTPSSRARVDSVLVRGWSVIAGAPGALASVLQDLLAFHHHVLAGLDVDGAGAVDGDVLAANDDAAVLFHADAGRAGGQGDGVAGVEGKVLA